MLLFGESPTYGTTFGRFAHKNVLLNSHFRSMNLLKKTSAAMLPFLIPHIKNAKIL